MTIYQEYLGQAVFSDDMVYRYSLSRIWDREKENVLFIMLNPSTADAYKLDPTIKRCEGFAKEWGYGAIHIVNLFAIRATDPKKMISHPDPIGNRNDTHIIGSARAAHLIIAAWGNNPNKTRFKKRAEHIIDKITEWRDIHCLTITKDGEPSHPLYLPSELKPIIYRRKRDDTHAS